MALIDPAFPLYIHPRQQNWVEWLSKKTIFELVPSCHLRQNHRLFHSHQCGSVLLCYNLSTVPLFSIRIISVRKSICMWLPNSDFTQLISHHPSCLNVIYHLQQLICQSFIEFYFNYLFLEYKVYIQRNTNIVLLEK